MSVENMSRGVGRCAIKEYKIEKRRKKRKNIRGTPKIVRWKGEKKGKNQTKKILTVEFHPSLAEKKERGQKGGMSWDSQEPKNLPHQGQETIKKNQKGGKKFKKGQNTGGLRQGKKANAMVKLRTSRKVRQSP